MIDSPEYFAAPGRMTAPGPWASLLEPLPGDIGALCRIVQGLMIHIFWAEHYGVRLAEARQGEVQLRSVAEKLGRLTALDPRPLTEAREPEKRLVGNCRDFSVLLTALLRHQGRPARARCGFARYFIPNHFEDHWVGEYWNAAERRWVLVDAQLDALQIGRLGVAFDPLDVPRDEFLADPEAFGIADLHGLWFIRGNPVRDVAALNKMELLPWDAWGLADARDEDLSSDDLDTLDRMAALTSGVAPELDRVRSLYESDARWRVPATIRSYSAAGAREVALALE